jgi:hypothetical protein
VDMHKDGKLRTMAEEEGLKLVYQANFHDFVDLMKTDQDASELARQSKVLPPFTKDTFTPHEWEAARLYCVFAFQKVRLGSRPHLLRSALRRLSLHLSSPTPAT